MSRTAGKFGPSVGSKSIHQERKGLGEKIISREASSLGIRPVIGISMAIVFCLSFCKKDIRRDGQIPYRVQESGSVVPSAGS